MFNNTPKLTESGVALTFIKDNIEKFMKKTKKYNNIIAI